MKKTLIILWAAISVLVLNNNASAQKIAHVSLDSIINIMPESKSAKQAGQEYYKQLESTVITMQNELQTKYKEYTDNEHSYTDLIKQTKQKELNDLNQRIQDFQTSAQQDLQRKNDELSKPVYEKAKKAIDQVAKEGGYKYVLDTGSVLYSEPADDITAAVMKKLGLSTPSPTVEQKKK